MIFVNLFNVSTCQKKVYFNELQNILKVFIDKLPKQQKRIFKLSRFERLPNKEIAEKLNISVRSVENQIYRAIKYRKETAWWNIFIIMIKKTTIDIIFFDITSPNFNIIIKSII